MQDGLDYAEVYKNEMEQLINIGFTRKKNNLKALILTGGNVEKAVDLISNAQEKHQRKKEIYATMEFNPNPEEAEAIEQVKTMGFNIKNNTKSLYLVRKVNFFFFFFFFFFLFFFSFFYIIYIYILIL